MRHDVQDAMNQTEEIRPIRSELRADGYYHLRARDGQRRVIGSGHANTVLANAGWPRRGEAAVLWVHADPA